VEKKKIERGEGGEEEEEDISLPPHQKKAKSATCVNICFQIMKW
jgi:hypothetical protein